MNWKYPLKHWITTLLVATFILYFCQRVVFGYKEEGFILMYPFYLFFSGLFLSPAIILYVVVYLFLERYKIQIKKSKFILITSSVIGIVASLAIIGINPLLRVIYIYGTTAIIAGITFKLKLSNTKIK